MGPHVFNPSLLEDLALSNGLLAKAESMTRQGMSFDPMPAEVHW